ncbi:MAG: DUF4111 domain-containing protein [Thermoleophilia bacterium]|nr:DUF4111 domain-containing protein [Thermoleophilia bacterium]
MAERTALAAAREVVAALGEVEAAYAIGSVATGGFEPGASDLDVVVVLAGEPTREELVALAERARSVDVAPARGLELVAYAGGRVVLNVNTGPGMDERVRFEGEDPAFWFVLDRASAEQHAVALAGPEWGDVFAPVSHADVLGALAASLRWHEGNEPASRNTLLNAARTWRYLETGEWSSKPEAALWLLARVRRRIEEAR